MFVKWLISALQLTAVVQAMFLPQRNQPISDGKQLINDMLYLGSVDGKSFFVEAGTRRTWLDAQAFCNKSNMHLASVETSNQAEILLRNKDKLNFTLWFWTGGRDAQTISQFAFDQENKAANNPGLDFRVDIDYQTCLLYGPYGITGTLVGSFFYSTWGVLCEIHSNTL